LVIAIGMALAFAFTNGLHDAANAIATLVVTRAARPGPAVLLAAVGNLIGPLLLGKAVADTIAGIVTVPDDEMIFVLGAALTGAVAWNAITWWRALSSSGHALLGGLVGAAMRRVAPAR
jgi:PiT family inorganic phosphate transporter